MNNTIYKELVNCGDYDLVSFCDNSIPTPGSPCRSIKGINTDYPVTVNKMIRHKTGDVTIITENLGYIRFWKQL